MNYLYHVWYVCYGRYGEQKEGACCCELQRKITTPGDYEDLVKAIKKHIIIGILRTFLLSSETSSPCMILLYRTRGSDLYSNHSNAVVCL